MSGSSHAAQLPLSHGNRQGGAIFQYTAAGDESPKLRLTSADDAGEVIDGGLRASPLLLWKLLRLLHLSKG